MNNRQQHFIIISPAYNEESVIWNYLSSIESALLFSEKDNYICKKIVICINGCTDNTENIIKQHSLYRRWKVKIIYSKLGNQYANISLYNYVREWYSNDYVLKPDSDVLINKDAISLLINELKENESLLVVGWHPIPNIDYSTWFFHKLKEKVFSVRANFYKSEVSKYDVSSYHNSTDSREVKSKIYFHWRIFLCRNISYLFLEETQIGDDVFLAAYLYTHYWKQIIKVVYTANCIYTPYKTFQHYWSVYRRIYEDKKILNKKNYILDMLKNQKQN